MIYPLVRELAETAYPFTVTCRVLGFSRQELLPLVAVTDHDARLGERAPDQTPRSTRTVMTRTSATASSPTKLEQRGPPGE